MKIRVLPDALINKISAGEVVDRPSSVVRELVDNAVDSGAREISVFLEQGGQHLIRVVDDGCGMSRQETLLAFERHATSKIQSEEDLEGIVTLGFRGEALPSIASVSRVRLRSRPREVAVATEVLINGGKIEKVSECAAPPGTDMEIRSLFFNTPARKKFLKQPKTEESRIKTWLRQASIPHPGIHYRLFVDGREVLNLAPKPSSIDRARALFQGSVVSFDERLEGLSATGIVAHPALAQSESGAFTLLVNGRLISDRMLLRAVKDGFDSTLKEREFPVGFLALTIPPHAVDVNVHPQKSEVRFISGQSIFLLVRSVVRNAVMQFKAPGNTVFPERVQSTGGMVREAVATPDYARAVRLPLSTPQRFEFSPRSALTRDGQFAVTEDQMQGTEIGSCSTENSNSGDSSFRFSDLRYVGEVLGCYLICERHDALVVVDMHAAHERCNYNLIRQRYERRSIAAQPMLVPLEVPCGEAARTRIEEHRPMLEDFGFSFDIHTRGLSVTAIPLLLVDRDVASVFLEIATLPDEHIGDGIVKERIDAIAARIACHASVRSGRELEREEVYALFRQLDDSSFAGACPHGRPVVVSFQGKTVESWFGRDR